MNSRLFLFFFLLFLVSAISCARSSDVLVAEVSGTIDEAQWELVQEVLREADNTNVEAIIMLLDTPGGGVDQTFSIADAIRESTIPVVGYVYPNGATAWSAGTLLLISTHVAVMAENTIIGSAQPVMLTPLGTQMVNDSKTINALVSWIQERARMYNRNASIAGEFITKNVNLNETQALAYGVIEYTASSLEELLTSIDGTVVETADGNHTLSTADASVDYFAPSFKVDILRVISNPIISSLLLLIGILSLIFGLQSPGLGAEVFGVIAIILSLVGSGLGLTVIGIIFLLIGCILLLVEVFVIPGFGFVGVGGLISLIIGSLFLIPTYPTHRWLIAMDYIQQVLVIIAVVAVLCAIFFGFLFYKFLQIHKQKTHMGVFVGEQAKTIDRITPDNPGYVLFKGEYWQARSDETIEPKTKVIIVQKDETTLVVKPKSTKTTP